MKNTVAAFVCIAAVFVAGFYIGYCCTPPAEVATVTKTRDVPGPTEVIVKERVVEVEKVVVDTEEVDRLMSELSAAKAESVKNLAGWRKTYELWLKLKFRDTRPSCN